ncbi:hypothetical protein T12_2151, partial [Trichinella patagoniensis]
LTNHANISTSSKSLHELLRARTRDGTKIVHEIRFRHTNSAINNRKSIRSLIRNDMNEQLRLGVQLAFVRQTLKSDLVQRIG